MREIMVKKVELFLNEDVFFENCIGIIGKLLSGIINN